MTQQHTKESAEGTSRMSRVGPIAGAILVVAGIAIIWMDMRPPKTTYERSESFFTVDDGKTWFADDAKNIPPYDKNGQQAVCAHVYRAADGTKFVNYLERFTPEAKQALEALRNPDPNQHVRGDPAAARSAFLDGREVKRPGDSKWVSCSDMAAALKVMSIRCPDGSNKADAVQP